MKFSNDPYLFEDHEKVVNWDKQVVTMLSIYIILGYNLIASKSNTFVTETTLLLVFKNLSSKTF